MQKQGGMKNRDTLFLACILLAISASYLLLSLRQDLRLSVHILVGVTAVCVGSLAVLLYRGEGGNLRLPAGVILLFALVFRLLFVFRLPQLSDDMYRYLWDALQLLHGNNPYALAPASTPGSLGVAAVALLPKINHPQLVTIYPPVSQLIFAAGAALSCGLTGLKIVLVTFDLALCVVILRLLRAMRLPAWRAAIYAWHPLPIIEISGSGHIDGAGILLLFTALLILFAKSGKEMRAPGALWKSRGRSLAAGFTCSAAVLVKLIPFIYFPMLLVAAGSPAMLTFGLLTGFALFGIPFAPDVQHMFWTLHAYVRNWEFSNFAFRMLRYLLSSGAHARWVLSSLFAAWTAFSVISFRIDRKTHPGQEALPILLRSVYAVTFGFLLLTPTLHPWYALYLVALLPFAAGPAGLVLSWAVFLSYRVLIDYTILGRWSEGDLTAGLIWLSPVAACLLSALLSATVVVKPAIGRICKDSRSPSNLRQI
jgi:hypothetical protein